MFYIRIVDMRETPHRMAMVSVVSYSEDFNEAAGRSLRQCWLYILIPAARVQRRFIRVVKPAVASVQNILSGFTRRGGPTCRDATQLILAC